MPEDVKEKEPESSTGTTPQSEVSKEETGAEDTSTSEQSTVPTVPDAGETSTADLYDEKGVPWKNRAMEWQRKHDETVSSLPQVVEQSVQAALSKIQAAPQQQQYTIEQLENYALQNPQYRPWVEAEKAKVLRGEIAKTIDEKISAVKQEDRKQLIRNQSEAYVAQNYSDMFIKNNNGQIVGWDFTNSMTKEVLGLMQDPRYKDDPEGLSVASDRVFARMIKAQVGRVVQTNKQLTGQVKKLEKSQMPEGAGKVAPAQPPKLKAALDRLRQTGSKEAASEAVSEHLRAIGMIKD